MIHYVKMGNSVFEMETITEFDITKSEEQEIIAEMNAKQWRHYRTIQHEYGRVIQWNVIFMREVVAR